MVKHCTSVVLAALLAMGLVVTANPEAHADGPENISVPILRTPGIISSNAVAPLARRMPGGVLIQGDNGICTSTIGLRNAVGTRFMVTAGHCTEVGPVIYTRPDAQNWNMNTTRYRVGSISQTDIGANGVGIDMAFIPTPWADHARVNTNLGLAPVASQAGAVREGQRLCKTGMAQNYNCLLTVTAVNQTVSTSNGRYTFSNQFKFCTIDGSPASVPGDSGGPIYHWNDSWSAVVIVGITSMTDGRSCGWGVQLQPMMQYHGLYFDSYGLAG